MSGNWKPILRTLLDNPDKYEEIFVNIYCVITDYHYEKIDRICSDETLKHLERAICDIDPDWALETFHNCLRCLRCSKATIEEDWKWLRVKSDLGGGFVSEHYCEDCYDTVRGMVEEYHTDDCDSESESEEDAEEKVEREVEWAAELGMGK